MELEGGREQAATQNATSYPFLNHSHTTLTNDLPPDVDNKPLARQRRKRTSPEDQAVLEAAYRLDPKPDKDARLRLVEQIALGEKEVQIWFQNRRQTSRRKSRPLLPHEIAQFQLSRYGSTSLDVSSDDYPETTDGLHEQPSDHIISSSSPESAHDSQGISSQAIATDCTGVSLETEQATTASHTDTIARQPASLRPSMPSLKQILSETSSSSINNTRLPLSFTGRPLKKASSYVRISTAGGNAQVITKDGFTPSPPRQEQIILSDLQHESSTQKSDGIASVDSSSFNSSLKRSLSGRSRDSRAWEFWCDKECRTELEDKAEKDGKGSAADAIGIIRATSNRKVLQPIPPKHGAFANRQQLWAAKRTVDGKRPPLQRAHTSGGRLQHADDRSYTADGKRVRLAKLSVLDTEASTYIPGNESDKENWSPSHESVSNGMTKNKLDSALPAGTKGHGRRPGKGHASTTIDAENVDPEADDEIASFMRGGRDSSKLSGAEELDCVQGLLSLSQGRWVS